MSPERHVVRAGQLVVVVEARPVEPAPGRVHVEDAIAVDREGEPVEVREDLDDLAGDGNNQQARQDQRDEPEEPLATDSGDPAGRRRLRRLRWLRLARRRGGRVERGSRHVGSVRTARPRRLATTDRPSPTHGAAAAAAIPSVPR